LQCVAGAIRESPVRGGGFGGVLLGGRARRDVPVQ